MGPHIYEGDCQHHAPEIVEVPALRPGLQAEGLQEVGPFKKSPTRMPPAVSAAGRRSQAPETPGSCGSGTWGAWQVLVVLGSWSPGQAWGVGALLWVAWGEPELATGGSWHKSVLPVGLPLLLAARLAEAQICNICSSMRL